MVFLYIIGTGDPFNRGSILETLSLGQLFLEEFYTSVVLSITGHEYFAFIDIGVSDGTELPGSAVGSSRCISFTSVYNHALIGIIVTLPNGCRSDGTSYSHGGVRSYNIECRFV